MGQPLLAEANEDRSYGRDVAAHVPDGPPDWPAIEAELTAARDANRRPFVAPVPV